MVPRRWTTPRKDRQDGTDVAVSDGDVGRGGRGGGSGIGAAGRRVRRRFGTLSTSRGRTGGPTLAPFALTWSVPRCRFSSRTPRKRRPGPTVWKSWSALTRNGNSRGSSSSSTASRSAWKLSPLRRARNAPRFVIPRPIPKSKTWASTAFILGQRRRSSCTAIIKWRRDSSISTRRISTGSKQRCGGCCRRRTRSAKRR